MKLQAIFTENKLLIRGSCISGTLILTWRYVNSPGSWSPDLSIVLYMPSLHEPLDYVMLAEWWPLSVMIALTFGWLLEAASSNLVWDSDMLCAKSFLTLWNTLHETYDIIFVRDEKWRLSIIPFIFCGKQLPLVLKLWIEVWRNKVWNWQIEFWYIS